MGRDGISTQRGFRKMKPFGPTGVAMHRESMVFQFDQRSSASHTPLQVSFRNRARDLIKRLTVGH